MFINKNSILVSVMAIAGVNIEKSFYPSYNYRDVHDFGFQNQNRDFKIKSWFWFCIWKLLFFTDFVFNFKSLKWGDFTNFELFKITKITWQIGYNRN